MGDKFGQSMPLAAACNETFKAARAAGKGDEDFCAVYATARAPNGHGAFVAR